MAFSPQALVKAIATRILPVRTLEGVESESFLRASLYGDLKVQSMVAKALHMSADEGSYFITNNGQTGIPAPAQTGFVNTTPLILIQNLDSAGGRRIYLDYLDLVTTLAGSAVAAASVIQAAVVLDAIQRFSTGGTNLTPNNVSPNMDIAGARSVAAVFYAPITLVPSAVARTVVGLRTVRPTVSATVLDVVGEEKHFNFGGIEAMLNGNIVVANANLISLPMPPIVIGPGQSALIYLWFVSTAPIPAQYAPELGWWER
jgi:hypothetical protein